MSHLNPSRGMGKSKAWCDEKKKEAEEKEAARAARHASRREAGEEVDSDASSASGDEESEAEAVPADDRAPEPTEPVVENLSPDEVTEEAVKTYSQGIKLVHVSKLLFDRPQPKWGQIRPLDMSRVRTLLAGLRANPPRVPISGLLLRRMGTGL